MSKSKTSGGLELAPLRSLDDFVLGKARFQVPAVGDLEKWGNRVAHNLLYYQTNYFLMAFALFLIIAVIHPLKMLCGLLVMVICFGVFCYVTIEGNGNLHSIKKNHPILSALAVLLIGYFTSAMLMGSLLISLLGLLVPFCAIFIHASLRLRNLKNKLANQFEAIGINQTPMGLFLEQLGILQEVS